MSAAALAFWNQLADALRDRQRVLLAVVAESSVHSPGTAGAKMFVAQGGRRIGTIGGGVMELQVQERAEKLLGSAEGRWAERAELHHTKRLGTDREDEAVQRSGMICAGRQTNLYVLLRPESDLAAVEGVADSLERGEGGSWWLDSVGRFGFDRRESPLTPLSQRGAYGPSSGRRPSQRGATETLDASAPPCRKGELEGVFSPHRILERDGNDWHFREALTERRRLAILGGGHCGQALARLMAGIGWHVSVWETREQVIHEADLDGVAELHRVDDFRHAAECIDLPGLTPVVVMTTDVPGDVRALLGALSEERTFPFVGAMGSSAKIEEIHRRLKDLGVTEEAQARLTAPVGLDIDSHTPSEIAVSVCAQLLQLRHEWLDD